MFVKICKFKKYVSTLAALPGAFVVISTAISDITNNKKERGQVVIPQATRVLFVVLFLPFIFVTQIGYQEIDSFGNIATYNLRYFLCDTSCKFISKSLVLFSLPLNSLKNFAKKCDLDSFLDSKKFIELKLKSKKIN